MPATAHEWLNCSQRKSIQAYDVCIISGTGFDSTIYPNTVRQIEQIPGVDLTRLHIMPTCGTRYYRYVDGAWTLQYQGSDSGAKNVFSRPLKHPPKA